MADSRFQRYELKYFISRTEADGVRRLIRPFARLDDYARLCPAGAYTVRSIYFDTAGLRFYHEKDAGLEIRKKLRLRTYNQPCRQAVGSVEIKRKYGQVIRKERVLLPQELALRAVGGDASVDGMRALSAGGRHTLERFSCLQSLLCLRPTVLIVYEREAYIGRVDRRARITFDQNTRSLVRPAMSDLYSEWGLRCLSAGRMILELKFDDIMPAWFRPVTAFLDRSHRPISKYCRGIDAWLEAERCG